MKRVTGIGGVFFKARDPDELKAWYVRHLGLPLRPDGGVMFEWREAEEPDRQVATVWAPFPRDTDYFEPSQSPFMINYRVADLDGLLAQLRREGVEVEDRRVRERSSGTLSLRTTLTKLNSWGASSGTQYSIRQKSSGLCSTSSADRKPATSSKSCPGVRMVIDRLWACSRPSRVSTTWISSGSSTATTSLTSAVRPLRARWTRAVLVGPRLTEGPPGSTRPRRCSLACRTPGPRCPDG